MVAGVVWDFDLGADGVAACDAGVARVQGGVVDAPAFLVVVEATACLVSVCVLLLVKMEVYLHVNQSFLQQAWPCWQSELNPHVCPGTSVHFNSPASKQSSAACFSASVGRYPGVKSLSTMAWFWQMR